MRYDVELIVSSQNYSDDYTIVLLALGTSAAGSTTMTVTIPYGSEGLVTVGSYLVVDPGGQRVQVTARQNLVDDEWLLTFDIELEAQLDPGMDVKVQTLYTNQRVLELYDNETISQNWQFSDAQTFEVLGSFSRSFRIPATSANCQAIGFLQDPNWSELIDYFQVKLPAELRVQTIPLGRGYIRVARAITQGDKLSDFEITFYDEAPDLFSKISGKKLKDIAALAELNAILDYDEVVNASGYPYLYSLSDYGQHWSEGGEAGTRSIYDESVTGCVRAGDLTPSLSWGWIFEQILTEAGFSYDAVDLINILNEYYAPWINSKELKYASSVQGTLFKYYLNVSIPASTSFVSLSPVSESFDNGNNVSGANFTAPATGVYYFRVWATINNSAAISSLNIGYRNFTQGQFIEVINQSVPIGITNYDSANTFVGVTAQAGDVITFWFRSAAGSAAILKHGSSYSSGTGVELYDVNFTDGYLLDWPANSPDVSQADFMRDVFNMHCCVMVPDRTVPNRLIIQTANNYIGSGAKRDWSRKLDISKDIVLSNTADFQYKELSFTYSEGDDVASQIYKNLDRIYGDYKITGYTVTENDVPTDFARDGEQKVQLTTQSTPCNYINGTSIIIPKFVDDEWNFVNPSLRCLFHAGDFPLYLWITSGNFPDTAYVVPVLNHYESTSPTFADADLNWAPESPLQLIQSNPINNLFNLYWRQYLNGLYSPQARIMEAYFALELVDIASFTFADLIWVKNTWWRILSIEDYKIGVSDSVKVTLIKYIEPGAETSALPMSVNDGGQVQFEDGAGNPVSPTKTACERYGYVWDPVTLTCSATPVLPISTQISAAKKVGTSTREVSNASNTIVMADNLDNAPTNQYVVAAGTDIRIETDNIASIAVGESLTKESLGGVAMFGKNVLTKMAGFHVGGGWKDNVKGDVTGELQLGEILMHTQKLFAAVDDTEELFINSIPNERIRLAAKNQWVLRITLNCMKIDYSAYYIGELIYRFFFDGSTAVAGPPALIYQEYDTDLWFEPSIDYVTDPEQHRVLLIAKGTGFPNAVEWTCTARLSYVQLKLP